MLDLGLRHNVTSVDANKRSSTQNYTNHRFLFNNGLHHITKESPYAWIQTKKKHN